MAFKLEDSARRLSSADIERIERDFGFSLPNDYKSFLLSANGGRPVPDAFPIHGMPKNPYGGIQVFFRIDGDIESNNLDWTRDIFDGRIPSNLLPIACDGSGNLICLSLFGDDAGSVLFWDFYNESPEPSYDNVYHIADSFEEFLDSIHERDFVSERN